MKDKLMRVKIIIVKTKDRDKPTVDGTVGIPSGDSPTTNSPKRTVVHMGLKRDPKRWPKV